MRKPSMTTPEGGKHPAQEEVNAHVNASHAAYAGGRKRRLTKALKATAGTYIPQDLPPEDTGAIPGVAKAVARRRRKIDQKENP